MIKEGCENDSALLIRLIFYLEHLEYEFKMGENIIMK